jgi:hypothetical protein
MCVIALTICVTSLIVVILMLLKKIRLTKDLKQRVHERTTELQKHVDLLKRFRTEKNLVLDGISKRINASLATMKGLGKIASTYENMPPELVKNIDVAADTLADILHQIAREKKG